jgi:hypothetical protein
VASVPLAVVGDWKVAVAEVAAGSAARRLAGNRHAGRCPGPDFDHRPVDFGLQPSPDVRRDPEGDRFGLAPLRRRN